MQSDSAEREDAVIEGNQFIEELSRSRKGADLGSLFFNIFPVVQRMGEPDGKR